MISYKYRIIALIKETDVALTELHKVLEAQRQKPKVSSKQKYTPVDMEAKEKRYQLLLRRLQEARDAEEMGGAINLRSKEDLGHMKVKLLNVEHIGQEGEGRDGELMDEEAQAIKRFKEYDARLDNLAELIGENVKELKVRAVNINEALDRHQEKLDDLDHVVQDAGQELETTTKKMKVILEKVRAGDRCCVTICLLLILIGLITVAYNLIGTVN